LKGTAHAEEVKLQAACSIIAGNLLPGTDQYSHAMNLARSDPGFVDEVIGLPLFSGNLGEQIMALNSRKRTLVAWLALC
jgi:hypothetical protein